MCARVCARYINGTLHFARKEERNELRFYAKAKIPVTLDCMRFKGKLFLATLYVEKDIRDGKKIIFKPAGCRYLRCCVSVTRVVDLIPRAALFHCRLSTAAPTGRINLSGGPPRTYPPPHESRKDSSRRSTA